jgi:hypothetical protein
MSELDTQNHDDEQEGYIEAAKSALVFSLLFLAVTIALWGYVYLQLMERGMTQ